MNLFRRDQLPRFAQVHAQFPIADAWQLDSYPTGASYIRWPVIFPWFALNQHRLNSDGGGHRHRYVAIVMMVDRAHCKYAFANKERGLTVRELFDGLRQRQTEVSHARDVCSFAGRLF